MRRDALRNWQRLLEAAREVFAEQGHSARVDDIARRAGVGVGTLYRHFATKDDLLDTLWRELLESIVNQTAQTAAAQPPGLGLEVCLWSIGAEMEAYRGYLGLMWQAFPPAESSHRLDFWALMQRLLDEAQQAGEARADLTLSDVFFCVLSLRAVIDDTADSAPPAWRRHLSLLLAGFRPSPRPLGYGPVDDAVVMTGVQRRHPTSPE